MMTYNIDQFEKASDYFKSLCRSGTAESIEFLKANSNKIIEVFIQVC